MAQHTVGNPLAKLDAEMAMTVFDEIDIDRFAAFAMPLPPCGRERDWAGAVLAVFTRVAVQLQSDSF